MSLGLHCCPLCHEGELTPALLPAGVWSRAACMSPRMPALALSNLYLPQLCALAASKHLGFFRV
jgi:hypothetical protein